MLTFVIPSQQFIPSSQGGKYISFVTKKCNISKEPSVHLSVCVFGAHVTLNRFVGST